MWRRCAVGEFAPASTETRARIPRRRIGATFTLPIYETSEFPPALPDRHELRFARRAPNHFPLFIVELERCLTGYHGHVVEPWRPAVRIHCGQAWSDA